MAQRAKKPKAGTNGTAGNKGGAKPRRIAPGTLRKQDLLERATRHIRLGRGSLRSGRSV